jgi:hypothetical protein
MCAEGWSWTCASSHMVDMARHVDLYAAAPGKTAMAVMLKPDTPFGSKDEHFMTYAEWQAEWTKAMKAQDLRNYVGGKTYHAGDAYHVELPNSRMLHSAPEVQTCMKTYAEMTRLGKYKPNTKFENGEWKADLAPHIKAAEAEKKKQEEEQRREEIRKMKFDGTAKGKVKLGRALSKSAKLAPVSIGDILPPSPIDSGGARTKPVSVTAEATWDSLGRDIFEKIGLTPTSGFDIKVICGVGYGSVTFDNLSQSFLSDLKVWAEVVYNTPVARFCKLDVDADAAMELKTSDKAPKGTVLFDIRLTTPVQKFSATVTVKADGTAATATVKVK